MATTLPQPFDSTDFDSPTVGNVSQTLPGLFDYSNVALTPTSVVDATVGYAYTQQITISGGYAPYSNLTVSVGNLPANLSLSVTTQDYGNDIATANITGIPNTVQTANFTISGTDTIANNVYLATQDYSLQVVRPNIVVSPSSLSNGSVGTFYTQTFTSANAVGTLTYSNIGSLPANLTLNSATGNLSGIPPANTSTNFTILVTDEYGSTGNTAYTLIVNRPTITVGPSSLSNAIVGNTYTQTFTASGGVGTYTYSNVGNLPPSLTLASTGSLTGTITSNTTPANFTVVATDSYSSTGNTAYTLNIAQPAITVTPSTISNGVVGTAYTATVSATGGIAPYTFSVTGGTLPTSLALNSATGNITGTPTANATSTFTITAYDFYRSTGNLSYTVGVTRPAITVTPLTLANGVVGVSYTETITATGGVAPYSWGRTGTIPSGLSLSGNTAVGNTGTVTFSGIPTASGLYNNFNIVATDSYGTQGLSNTYVVNMALPTITVSPSSLSNAVTGSVYSVTLTAAGGTGPYTFSVTGNTLPASLTLNANTGVLSGIVNADGTANFTITATDAYFSTGNRAYSLTTTDPAVIISPTTANSGVVGVPYTQTFTSSGGTGPYTYSITDGALPANLVLGASGSITGTPTVNDNSTFTVTSTDSFASQGSFTYANVSITLPEIILDPPDLPEIYVGNVYVANLVAFGGTDPYTFAVTSGNLPTGLSLDSTGHITGTTTAADTFDFTVTATDSYNSTGSEPYTIVVKPPDITISPSTIPNGEVDVDYTATFTASGSTEPYTFTSNTLPSGLSLNSSTGILSGAPTDSGYQPFTITATDPNGYPGTQSYNFVVIPNIPTSAIEVYVGGILQASGLFTATTTSSSNVLTNVSNFNRLTVGTYLEGPVIANNTVITSIDQSNQRIVMSNIASRAAANTQISYSSGYTVTSKSPATIEFTDPPSAGVDITVAVRQGQSSWYQPSPYTPSDGVPLQETDTPAARFLRGVN